MTVHLKRLSDHKNTDNTLKIGLSINIDNTSLIDNVERINNF